MVRDKKLGLTLLTFSFVTLIAWADEAPPPGQDHRGESAKPPRSELDLAMGEQWRAYYEEDRDESLHPLHVFGDQLIALAQGDSSDEKSLLAADFLMRYGAGVSGEKHHRCMTEGMRAALERHIDNAQLVAVLQHIGDGGTPEREIEGFLRDVLRGSTNPTVRAGAALELAGHLDALCYIRNHLKMYTARLRAAFPEHGPQLDDLESYLTHRDSSEMRREAAELLRMIIETLPDEQPVIRKELARRGLDAEYVRDEAQPTYGTLASRLLYAVENLREDCTAPEIVGEDETGSTFRLSDSRGKVVLLMFSFPSCSACRPWYPINRDLLEHFKDEPFAVLGVWASVGTDDTLEGLQKSIEDGEITWRCWWDGRDTPITTRWDVHGWPTVYLIDGRGIIRRRFPQRDLESLKTVIAGLINDIDEGCVAAP